MWHPEYLGFRTNAADFSFAPDGSRFAGVLAVDEGHPVPSQRIVVVQMP